MKLYVFIKKFTLTPEINSRYWGEMGQLLALTWTDDQMQKLFAFYAAADDYLTEVRKYLTQADGQRMLMLKPDDNSTEVFYLFGLLNPEHYSQIVKGGPVYQTYKQTVDSLFEVLGWSEGEERVTVIDSEFVPEDYAYLNVPQTYQEANTMYATGTPVNQFFGE